MEKIKKGDYLVIRTNEPIIGFIERFGYGMEVDDVEPENFTARVLEVMRSQHGSHNKRNCYKKGYITTLWTI